MSLSELLRPSSLEDFLGQKHLLSDNAPFRKLLEKGSIPHSFFFGPPGTGKTTLLKIINRQLRADSGKIRYGSKVSIGYYDQEHHNLEDSNTLFEEIADAYPDMTNTKIRLF